MSDEKVQELDPNRSSCDSDHVSASLYRCTEFNDHGRSGGDYIFGGVVFVSVVVAAS
jgi:hypothetical protein